MATENAWALATSTSMSIPRRASCVPRCSKSSSSEGRCRRFCSAMNDGSIGGFMGDLPVRSSRVRGGDSAIHVEEVAGELRGAARGEEHDRLGNVLGEDVPLQRRALPVELLELVGVDPVVL